MDPETSGQPVRAPKSDSISTKELKACFDRGDSLVLLDVREPKEREICFIAGQTSTTQLHIPMREIPDSLDSVRRAEGATIAVVAYCHHGVRSRMAAGWLSAQGVPNVMSLDGGIDAWSQDIDPKVPRY